MATKSVSWREQGLVTSPEECFSESWAQGNVDGIVGYSSPLQDKKAPKAEPEEDIDVLEPGAEDETLQLNQTLPRLENADATKRKNLESTRLSLGTPRKTHGAVTELEQVPQRSEALKAQKESKESADLCKDDFPPPYPISSSTEESFEKDADSAEWISDGEITLYPAEELTSPDSHSSQEWIYAPDLTEPVDGGVDPMSETDMATEENFTQLIFFPGVFHSSEPLTNMSGPAHHSLSDRKDSDDACTVCSPPFADESEEEEEVSIDTMSCQQRWNRLDVRSKPLHNSYSANIPISTEQEPSLALSAVSSAKQQKALLSKSQCKFVLRGAIQEAAQQVLGQGSPPLSTVAMELPNQGGATSSRGSGCVVAVRERHSRAGESTEGESKQAGKKKGQTEGGLKRNEAVGQQHGRRLLKTVQTQELNTVRYRFVASKHSRMESDSCDDSQSDSGVSADFSPSSTFESNTSTSPPAAVPKETPIEREIRRSVEREQSLRRSRGLPNSPTSPEFVEIPLRKIVLSQSLTESEKCPGKERQFAGQKMKHEIHKEAQREQDLVKLGKVPGFYDKGTVRQLKERKQLFEAFQQPSDSALIVSTRSKAISWSSASDISTLENQEDTSSQASTMGHSYVERNRTQRPSSPKGRGSTSVTPRGPDFCAGAGCRVIILDNNPAAPAQELYHHTPAAELVTAAGSGRPNISSSRTSGRGGMKGGEQEKEEEEEVAPKENPFFKLRSSTNVIKVKQDIREAQERERELHKQRISLYGNTEAVKGGGTGGGGGGRRGKPAGIEGKSPMLSSSSLNGPGSSSRGVTGAPAVRQSVGKLGMWPPAQAEEEQISRTEALHSPRSPRQKSPLVQRWESGLVNGHKDEDD